MFIVPNKASGQGLEITGGWAHVTKDFGTDGFNVGADWWLWRRVALGGEYDSAWDTSIIGNFTLTTIPGFTFRTHLQNYLFGPRIFFRNEHAEKHRLEPFAEVEFGGSHLNQTVEQTGFSSASGASSGFSWMFGGGVDYMLTSHWFGRGRLGFLRTNFVNEGQNRLRFVVEIGYTFGQRERKK
jgi:hypothetical protein